MIAGQRGILTNLIAVEIGEIRNGEVGEGHEDPGLALLRGGAVNLLTQTPQHSLYENMTMVKGTV
jgi:hypothetical protein